MGALYSAASFSRLPFRRVVRKVRGARWVKKESKKEILTGRARLCAGESFPHWGPAHKRLTHSDQWAPWDEKQTVYIIRMTEMARPDARKGQGFA